MAIKRSYRQRLYLNTSEAYVEFDVSELTEATVYLDYDPASGSALSTAVVTVERSPDGEAWYAMQSATTLAAEAATSDLDVSNANRLRVRVSTAQANAGYAHIHIVGVVDAGQ